MEASPQLSWGRDSDSVLARKVCIPFSATAASNQAGYGGLHDCHGCETLTQFARKVYWAGECMKKLNFFMS